MPVPYKVRFDDDGSKCPRSIIELRNKPECGVLFREEQPFKPNNRFPLPKNFDLRSLDPKDIPKKIIVPKGVIDPSEAPLREDPRQLAFQQEILDYDLHNNEYYVTSRRLSSTTGLYERIPEPPAAAEINTEINRTFTHQDVDRVIQQLDETMPIMQRDMLVDPLEEPVLEQPRPITSRIPKVPQRDLLTDPRDTEFTEKLRPRGMTDEELIEEQIQQLKRSMPPDTHEEITKVAEQELFPTTAISEEMEILRSIDKYVRKGRNEISQRELDTIIKDLNPRGIPTERIMEVVNKYNAFDPVFEKAIGGVPDTQERAFLRRMKAVRTIVEDDPTILTAERHPSYGTFEDTNLLPKTKIEYLGDTNVPITEGDTSAARRKFTLSQEASYYARRARNLVPSQDYTDPQFNVLEETSFESTPATLPENTELGRRLKLEALGVREKMVRAGKKLFAQEYKPISLEEPVSFEMTTEGVTTLRIPETNAELGNLRDIPLDPFEATIARPKTKLSFAERISAPRVSDIAEGSIHTLGGLAGAIGISQLLSQLKVNKYANAAISTGSGDVFGRILNYSAKRVALRVGLRTTQVEALTAKSLLRGGLEGGAIGLAAMPVDNLLNTALRSTGMSHTASNMLSTGAVSAGATAAVWGMGVGGAEETFGLTLVAAALTTGIMEVWSFVTGQEQDKNVDLINSSNKVRQELIETLPKYNYNYYKALNAFIDEGKSGGLNMNNSDWRAFDKSMRETFSEKSITSQEKTKVSNKNVKTKTGVTQGLPDKNAQKAQEYFAKYILHNLIKKTCSGGKECNPELLKQDKGELTDYETNFLNSQTDFTWQSHADMQVSVSIKQMEFTQKRIQSAKEYIISIWEKRHLLPEQIHDPDAVALANLDPNFKQAFENAVKLDAQKLVVDAYYKDQTKFENLPEGIQKAANLDKSFYYHIHVFYEDTEKEAAKMNLSVPQLIELQGLPEKEQNQKYRMFQFDYAKMDEKTVNEALDIAKEEDKVREAGYYDIDQAYLSTDPTAVGIWKPTDSQILQAHSAGMTLQQYVNYMHELSKGKEGDFSQLPKFNEDQIRQSGILDFSHFQDELQMAGFDKNMYTYDPETLSITLNPNVSNVPIPSTENHFVSKYTPENLRRLHQETADLIHGLDQQNQGIIDTYNTKLREQLSVFGKNYNKQVASINDNRSYHGINNLLVYDPEADYQKYHLEFKPAEISTINNPAAKVNITPASEIDLSPGGAEIYIPPRDPNEKKPLDLAAIRQADYLRQKEIDEKAQIITSLTQESNTNDL